LTPLPKVAAREDEVRLCRQLMEQQKSHYDNALRDLAGKLRKTGDMAGAGFEIEQLRSENR
jgi:hypothetical protein